MHNSTNLYLYEEIIKSRYYDDLSQSEIDDSQQIQKSNQLLDKTITRLEDFKLFLEHYNVVDFEILDGCYFEAQIGLFDKYIDKWKEIKMTSKGAMRTLAKLFLNNLYGKFASNTDSSFKYAFLEDNKVKFKNIEAHDKPIGYIPIGSAITSYARNFTIRTAQKNYHGVNERGFIYADTDSIHCDLSVDELIDVPIHDSDFCHWKMSINISFIWNFIITLKSKTIRIF